MAARRVRDLQRTHLFVAADHLPVGVLYCRDVTLPEGAAYEPKDEGALADSARPEHDHAVVVALFRHDAQAHRPVALKHGKGNVIIKVVIVTRQNQYQCYRQCGHCDIYNISRDPDL